MQWLTTGRPLHSFAMSSFYNHNYKRKARIGTNINISGERKKTNYLERIISLDLQKKLKY